MVIVVVDTNVFVRQTYLCQKQQGPALIAGLRASGGKLFLPEILRQEYHEQTQLMVNELRGEFHAHRDKLKSLIKLHDPVVFPDDAEIRAQVEKRLEQLRPLTHDGPAIADVMMAAGLRSVGKRVPSTKSDHGLKDCIIWESILNLPSGTEIWLISNDHGFYKDKTDEAHPVLIDEATAKGLQFTLARNFKSIVEEIAKRYPELQLSELEKREISEQDSLVSTPLPAASLNAIVKTTGSTENVERIEAALSKADKQFDGLALRVLGYMAYLDPVAKTDLFEALASAGISLEVARNVAERLVLSGLVLDSGSNYLVVDRSLGDDAAGTVEADIIDWLRANRGDKP